MRCGASESVVLSFVLITCYLVRDNVEGGSLQKNYADFKQTHFCNDSSFRCDSGECIDEDNLCDGVVHCKDGSDETRDCVNIIPCSSSFLFQCDYGACINKAQQCDGKYDCKDKSDETEIACAKCGHGMFQCTSGECISDENVCDGTGHCKDLSDETVGLCQNFNCPSYSYRCKYGACVNRASRCDGVFDCIDASDEKGCAAYNPHHTTSPPSPRCPRYDFKCNSGECVNENKVCNGKKDCFDGSDETFDLCAFKRCPFNKIACDYGGCVPAGAWCNGFMDCWDASDERNCTFAVPTDPPPPANVEGGCAIPKNPINGEYEVTKFQKHGVTKTRGTVPELSVLATKCDQGFAPTPPKETSLSLCFNGGWTPSLQQCSRTCPALISSTQTECKYDNKLLNSCDNAVHGTVALTVCDDMSHSLLQICRNGEWDIPISRCLPSTSTNSSGTVINIFYIFKDKTKR